MQRRAFPKTSLTLGAGLGIGFHIPVKDALALFDSPAPQNFPPNAFVCMAPDNTVSVISKHAGMGQGIYTRLMTILADAYAIH